MLHAMIMAGGGGTRFWPRSRQRRPKQFLTFSGDRTLLQGTVDRVAAMIPPERTWVVTGEQYREEAAAQLRELPADQIVASGEYFWNSGIFVWKPAAILGELGQRKPALHDAVVRIADAWGTPRFADAFRSEYQTAEKISIDFAVMQDAAKAGK